LNVIGFPGAVNLKASSFSYQVPVLPPVLQSLCALGAAFIDWYLFVPEKRFFSLADANCGLLLIVPVSRQTCRGDDRRFLFSIYLDSHFRLRGEPAIGRFPLFLYVLESQRFRTTPLVVAAPVLFPSPNNFFPELPENYDHALLASCCSGDCGSNLTLRGVPNSCSQGVEPFQVSLGFFLRTMKYLGSSIPPISIPS